MVNWIVKFSTKQHYMYIYIIGRTGHTEVKRSLFFLKLHILMQNLIVFIDGQCHKAITVFIDI